MFEASLGATPLIFTGRTAAAGSSQTALAFSAPHGLVPQQAVTHGGEIRFVEAIVDPVHVQLNAPLSVTPSAGEAIGPTITYLPALDHPSADIFHHLIPATAPHR